MTDDTGLDPIAVSENCFTPRVLQLPAMRSFFLAIAGRPFCRGDHAIRYV